MHILLTIKIFCLKNIYFIYTIRNILIYWVISLCCKHLRFWVRIRYSEIEFNDQSGSWSLNLHFFLFHFHISWKCASKILKHPNKISFYWRKTGFWRPFWIFSTKLEVDFLKQYFFLITTIQPENLPLEFWRYLN